MFVDTYFKIACSFTNVDLITSTRASVYYVRWMRIFVFEFEEGFDLACLPQDMEVKFFLTLKDTPRTQIHMGHLDSSSLLDKKENKRGILHRTLQSSTK